MAVEILGFLLFLALSYGVLYFLTGPKRAASGWLADERRVDSAVIGTVVVSAMLCAMLVGPLPTVLLVVALLAFIADRQSSKEPLDLRAVSDLVQGLIGLIGPLKQRLPELLARADLGWVRRHSAFATARRTLGTGGRKGADLLRAFVRSVAVKYKGTQASRRAVRAAQRSAGPSGIEAALPATAGIVGQPAVNAEADVLPRQPARRLTRDQVKRLLNKLEGCNTQS